MWWKGIQLQRVYICATASQSHANIVKLLYEQLPSCVVDWSKRGHVMFTNIKCWTSHREWKVTAMSWNCWTVQHFLTPPCNFWFSILQHILHLQHRTVEISCITRTLWCSNDCFFSNQSYLFALSDASLRANHVNTLWGKKQSSRVRL